MVFIGIKSRDDFIGKESSLKGKYKNLSTKKGLNHGLILLKFLSLKG